MQEAAFDTISFFVLTSSFPTTDNISNLTTAHPPLCQLHQAITTLVDYDFRWVKEPNPEWATQSKIDPCKHSAFLASLFHYRMDASLVMHYLGGNYTATHQNVDDIIQRIAPYVDANLLQHYRRVMTTGCPNDFTATCLWDNFMTYFKHGNNPSIVKKLEAVMKTMNKEEHNNFVILLPAWVAWFTPHIFLTPQHNLVKDRKKD